LGFGANKCGEWATKRDIYPCGLIASTLGWPVVDIWNNNAYGLEECPSYTTNWLSFINRCVSVVFSMIIPLSKC
jgi:hypothetical protein